MGKTVGLVFKQEVDFNDLKVSELKDLLKEKGIEFESTARKEDLVELLEGAE